ncbi:membrane spanning protein in TonB-ExbB-ExbD complex [Syntrophobacter sp. SbD1]|nr:membrane spanning protein in TonB-ExbB-ExbD complex [Syntrophobacter sp. SbD1]
MQANGNSKGMVSDINVTPLVDVMLVLLIIFMVTAPMMTQGVDVKLPESSAPAIASDDERLVVTVTMDRKIFINDNVVELGELESKLAAITENRQDRKGVFLRADEQIPYGYVMQVMGLIRQAGIDQIGMVTESAKEPANHQKGRGKI